MDKTFWINDPSVLINDVSNYITREDMNEIEKLNSIKLMVEHSIQQLLLWKHLYSLIHHLPLTFH